MQLLIYTMAGVLGIVVGSFLNVCIYRLPREESVVIKPSHCTSCGVKIKRYDLIPILSYIFLKGKCRNCKATISLRYPFIELLNGLLWIYSYYSFGLSVKTILVSLMFSSLIIVAYMDWDTQLININNVNFILLLAVFNIIFVHEEKLWSYLIGSAIVSIPFLLIHIFSKGKAMGFGDVYLMFAAGLFLGLEATATAIMIALVLGSFCGILIKHVTKSSRFAFGPFLSIGIGIAAVYGNNIFNWYLNLIRIN